MKTVRCKKSIWHFEAGKYYRVNFNMSSTVSFYVENINEEGLSTFGKSFYFAPSLHGEYDEDKFYNHFLTPVEERKEKILEIERNAQ